MSDDSLYDGSCEVVSALNLLSVVGNYRFYGNYLMETYATMN